MRLSLFLLPLRLIDHATSFTAGIRMRDERIEIHVHVRVWLVIRFDRCCFGSNCFITGFIGGILWMMNMNASWGTYGFDVARKGKQATG